MSEAAGVPARLEVVNDVLAQLTESAQADYLRLAEPILRATAAEFTPEGLELLTKMFFTAGYIAAGGQPNVSHLRVGH